MIKTIIQWIKEIHVASTLKTFQKKFEALCQNLSLKRNRAALSLYENFEKNDTPIESKHYSTFSLRFGEKFPIPLEEYRKKYYKISLVILNIKIPDILVSKENISSSYLSELKNIMESLKPYLRKKIKIYIHLSHFNQLMGCTEYLKLKNKETILIGFTMPSNSPKSIAIIMQKLKEGYEDFILSTDEILMSSDSKKIEADLYRKLYLFPRQLEYLKNHFLSLLEQSLLLRIPGKKLIFLGAYFSANNNSLYAHNFLPGALKTESPASTQSILHKNSSYLSTPIGEIIDQQIQELHPRNWWKKCSVHRFYYFLIFTLFISFVGIVHQIQHEKDHQTTLLKFSNALLTPVQAEKIDQSKETQVSSLKKTIQSYFNLEKRMHSLKILPKSYQINSSIRLNLNQLLSHKFIPSIEDSLENALKKREIQLDTLYLNLKAAYDHDPHSLTEAICYEWLKQTLWPSEGIEQCLYLGQLLKKSSFSLKSQTVQNARAQLLEYSIPERIFNILLVMHALNPNLNVNLNKISASRYEGSFIDKDPSSSVLGLFANNYVKTKLSSGLKKALKQAQYDSTLMGLNEDIDGAWDTHLKQEFMEIYFKHYQSYWVNRIKSIHIKPFRSINHALRQIEQFKSENSILKNLIDFMVKQKLDHSVLNEEALKKFDYTELTTILNSVYQLLSSIEKNSNSAKISLELSKSTFNSATDSPLVQLMTLAKHSPFPLNQWLREISLNAWGLVAELALQEINQAWREEIATFYEQHIDNRYPLVESSLELSLEEFTEFFGPDKRLDSFFKTYFDAFIDQYKEGWKLKTREGLRLELREEDLKFLENTVFIKTHYFNPTEGTPFLQLNIKPLSLSHITRLLKLSYPPTQLLYQHGPQFVTHLSWPGENEAPSTQLELQGFNHQKDLLTFKGNWSLFRLLDYAEIEAEPNTQNLILSYRFEDQFCSFLLMNTQERDTLTLNPFKNLHFPDFFKLKSGSIASTGENHE